MLQIPELTQQEIAERNGYKHNSVVSDIKNSILSIIPDAGKNDKTDENELFYSILFNYHAAE